MELYSAEVTKLKTLLEEWWTHRETELEATFGAKGQVDVQTFLTVATRLRSRGFASIPQQERLNICLPDHIRFGLVGMGQIQQYCKDDTLAGKSFIAMIKDRAAGTESNVDIPDYDLRIKSRREIPMAEDDARVKGLLARWPTQNKAFRLIRRWTFVANGVKFDLSMVRSTPRNSKGDFLWVRRFREHNLLRSAPIYEIEVELEREKFTSVDEAYKGLMRGVGDVLRGIQRSPLLIRKKTAQEVLKDYMAMVGSNRFVGVSPVTMQLDNMVKDIDPKIPNIREGYNVTDKADGLRVMPYCNSVGELFLIDMGMNVYRTGLKNSACANSLLDAEWITKDSEGKSIQLLGVFDIYRATGNQDVMGLPFKEGRYPKLNEWVKTWTAGVQKSPGAQLLVSQKQFLFANKGDTTIFTHCAARILDTEKPYPTDGLIFTPNDLPLPKGGTFWQQFKWKPAEDNTVDFLVVFEKDPDVKSQDRILNAVHPASGKYVKYKIMRLLIASDRDTAYDNPRATILYEQPLPRSPYEGDAKGEYKPAVFSPREFPDSMASVCNREVVEEDGDEIVTTERTGEPIRDRSIVECRYDPSQPSGWRWIPIRVRADKTDRFNKGEIRRTLNGELNAESVWRSIHQPITESMIRTGAEQPADDEAREMTEASAVTKRYYDRKAPTEDLQKIRGLRDFHNRWVKDVILYSTFFNTGVGKSLIDVAVGQAGDLRRWSVGKASFVLGVDVAGEGILDRESGAYRRYINNILQRGRDGTPTCVFVIGDSQKRYINGDAGATPEEADLLRSIFGRVKPQGAIPPFIESSAAGRLREGADGIACQFALHYFFKDEETLNGLLQNIRDTLKIGGYFFGAAFDGEKVFELLRGLQKGEKRSGYDDTSLLWTITKQYEADELPAGSDAFGMPIDIEFISIGTTQTEYLIPFSLLVDKLKTVGLELLGEEDLKKMGLRASSSTFDVSYEMARAAGKKFFMTDAVKQFSFLNRWFMFKRTSEGTGVEEPPTAAEVAQVTGAVAAVAKAEIPEAVDEVVTVTKLDAPVAAAAKEAVAGTAARPAAAVVPEVAPVGEAVAAGTDLVEAEQTIPVAKLPSVLKTYTVNDLFQFDTDSVLQDKLKIGDKGAARWAAPSAHFPIPDPDDSSIVYPSVEHYIAGQRLKLASNKPDLGAAIFSRDGSIHQAYVRRRLELTAAGTRPLTEEQDYALVKEESDEVRDQSKATNLRVRGAVVDEAKFATVKNQVLRDALRIRVEKDARLRRILDAARGQGKILLYNAGKAKASELGGSRKQNGTIDGQNKIGKFLMELAGGFPDT